MASACLNQITISPEKFFSRPTTTLPPWLSPKSPPPEQPDLEFSGDFEFCLDVPVNIIPADELFSNGKLITSAAAPPEENNNNNKSPEKNNKKSEMLNSTDPCLFSPWAPRCSSRWKDLLGLKKLNIINVNNINGDSKRTSSAQSDGNYSLPNSRSSVGNIISSKSSLKMFLHRSSKSTGSSAESSPLLLPTEEFVVAASGRHSLSSSSSSSSSSGDADMPRHSLDLDKYYKRLSSQNQNPTRVRLARKRTVSSENPVPTRMSKSSNNGVANSSNNISNLNNGVSKGISADSPRMNASGRVIFQGLERSSSSPSSFNNGGTKMKYKGMERSYSANVRVLNVPVCSLMGSSKSSVFGFQLFPSNNAQKSGVGGGVGGRGHVSKVRTEK